jgi:hypothetical protein
MQGSNFSSGATNNVRLRSSASNLQIVTHPKILTQPKVIDARLPQALGATSTMRNNHSSLQMMKVHPLQSLCGTIGLPNFSTFPTMIVTSSILSYVLLRMRIKIWENKFQISRNFYKIVLHLTDKEYIYFKLERSHPCNHFVIISNLWPTISCCAIIFSEWFKW